MGLRFSVASLLLSVVVCLFLPGGEVRAETPVAVLEQSVSDTLDLWREGRYEQLYDSLSNRGSVTRERFVADMRSTTIRPACCWQKIQNFRVVREKRAEATVYARVTLEGTPGPVDSSTRDFKLSREDDGWKMRLHDILSLAGISGKKGKSSRHRNNIITAPYQ